MARRTTALLTLVAAAHAFTPAVRVAPRSGLALSPAAPTFAAAAPPRVAAPPTMGLAATALGTVVAANRGIVGACIAALGALFVWLARVLNTPSRVYDREANTVGREYDAWTSEGILEYYWGEHIHLGWYGESERSGPFYGGKDFIEAKYDFIDKMLGFSQTEAPATVLDVGCGIGGTSRYIAKKFPEAQVTGITISPEQQRRATQLAAERGVANAKFELCDALAMTYPDNSFDLVWACESGEHMPDKEKYVQEMARVLKPGARTRRQRSPARLPAPFRARGHRTQGCTRGPSRTHSPRRTRAMLTTCRRTDVPTCRRASPRRWPDCDRDVVPARLRQGRRVHAQGAKNPRLPLRRVDAPILHLG
jgi:SAM-dependent methyltransferase